MRHTDLVILYLFDVLINGLVLILDNIQVLIHLNTYSNTLKLLNSTFKSKRK